MTTDPRDIWTNERDFAREPSTEERAEIDRIDVAKRAEAARLEAAYSRAPSRNGGPAHLPKVPKIRG